MSIKWKYKIEISNKRIFKEIETERGIDFPNDLQSFILEHNAATPEQYNFMVGSNERVFGAVLSFNREDKDVDSAFDALNVVVDRNLIPFGVDPFGNFICFALDSETIVFWNHEKGTVDSTGIPFVDFEKNLY